MIRHEASAANSSSIRDARYKAPVDPRWLTRDPILTPLVGLLRDQRFTLAAARKQSCGLPRVLNPEIKGLLHPNARDTTRRHASIG